MSPALPARPSVAIAGATGAVGVELLRILEERDLPLRALRLLASERSRGQKLRFRGQEVPVDVLSDAAFDGIDVAFFSCGKERSLRFGPAAAERGAVVIDNSSAFRLDPAHPLVVPEVNAAALWDGHGGLTSRIVANPNCTTILLVVALAPLHRAFGLRAVVVASYQAASGAGAKAMQALIDDTRQRLVEGTDAAPASTAAFGHPLPFNVVPQIDVFQPDGHTGEEHKVMLETRKILGLPDLRLDATCVRVPVLRCHSESVSLATERPATVAAARAALGAAPGVELVDEPERRRYPMPILADGRDPVLVGRLRESQVFPGGLQLWLSGDQLRKGAALNAVQIVEVLMHGAAAPSERPSQEKRQEMSQERGRAGRTT